MRRIGIVAALLGTLASAAAAETGRYELVIKNHRFVPAELHVPAGSAFVITVKNEDPTVEEFDSSALSVEKVIPGGRSLNVRVRALEAGRYDFIGEYHSDTAKGVVIVGTGK